MKDIPVFTTEYGAASLVLREIPYTQTAYIRLQATLEPEKLIEECVGFCRAVGAEKIYAAGHPALEQYPFHTAIWKMARQMDGLPDTDAALWPVQAETVDTWQSIYNGRMKDVDNSAWFTQTDAKEMLRRGGGYFVHRGDTLLGIGRASGERLDAVVAVQPGAGTDVVLALTHAMAGERLVLEVASTNTRALRLYEKLGFTPVAEINHWYKVYGLQPRAGEYIFPDCKGKILDKVDTM